MGAPSLAAFAVPAITTALPLEVVATNRGPSGEEPGPVGGATLTAVAVEGLSGLMRSTESALKLPTTSFELSGVNSIPEI